MAVFHGYIRTFDLSKDTKKCLDSIDEADGEMLFREAVVGATSHQYGIHLKDDDPATYLLYDVLLLLLSARRKIKSPADFSGWYPRTKKPNATHLLAKSFRKGRYHPGLYGPSQSGVDKWWDERQSRCLIVEQEGSFHLSPDYRTEVLEFLRRLAAERGVA